MATMSSKTTRILHEGRAVTVSLRPVVLAAEDSEGEHAPRSAHGEAEEPADGRRLAVALDDLAVLGDLELVQEAESDENTLGERALRRGVHGVRGSGRGRGRRKLDAPRSS